MPAQHHQCTGQIFARFIGYFEYHNSNDDHQFQQPSITEPSQISLLSGANCFIIRITLFSGFQNIMVTADVIVSSLTMEHRCRRRTAGPNGYAAGGNPAPALLASASSHS
jgi:hypothetical protein